jgi:hypothetical protein
MFGRAVRPGDELLALLQPLVSAKTLEDAQSYAELLFTPHIKEELVQSINPLSEVELAIVDGLGKSRRRHLSLQFNRVMHAGQVRIDRHQDTAARGARLPAQALRRRRIAAGLALPSGGTGMSRLSESDLRLFIESVTRYFAVTSRTPPMIAAAYLGTEPLSIHDFSGSFRSPDASAARSPCRCPRWRSANCC